MSVYWACIFNLGEKFPIKATCHKLSGWYTQGIFFCHSKNTYHALFECDETFYIKWIFLDYSYLYPLKKMDVDHEY